VPSFLRSDVAGELLSLYLRIIFDGEPPTREDLIAAYWETRCCSRIQDALRAFLDTFADEPFSESVVTRKSPLLDSLLSLYTEKLAWFEDSPYLRVETGASRAFMRSEIISGCTI